MKCSLWQKRARSLSRTVRLQEEARAAPGVRGPGPARRRGKAAEAKDARKARPATTRRGGGVGQAAKRGRVDIPSCMA